MNRHDKTTTTTPNKDLWLLLVSLFANVNREGKKIFYTSLHTKAVYYIY